MVIKTDKGASYIPEIYLEMQEFIYVNEKYTNILKEKLNNDLNLTDYNYIYHRRGFWKYE